MFCRTLTSCKVLLATLPSHQVSCSQFVSGSQLHSITPDELFACEESACESSAADLQSSSETDTQLARTRSHTNLIPQGEICTNWEYPRANDWRELQPHDYYCLGYLGQRRLNRTVKQVMQRPLFKSDASHYKSVACHEDKQGKQCLAS